MDVKIRNKFIEIKYSVSYGLVISIANIGGSEFWKCVDIDEVTDLSLKLLGKSVNSFNSFIYERNIYEIPFVICFRIDKWTESMLSITSNQECSIVQLVFLS